MLWGEWQRLNFGYHFSRGKNKAISSAGVWIDMWEQSFPPPPPPPSWQVKETSPFGPALGQAGCPLTGGSTNSRGGHWSISRYSVAEHRFSSAEGPFQTLLAVPDFKVPLPSPGGQGSYWMSDSLQASRNCLILDLRSTVASQWDSIPGTSSLPLNFWLFSGWWLASCSVVRSQAMQWAQITSALLLVSPHHPSDLYLASFLYLGLSPQSFRSGPAPSSLSLWCHGRHRSPSSRPWSSAHSLHRGSPPPSVLPLHPQPLRLYLNTSANASKSLSWVLASFPQMYLLSELWKWLATRS